MKISSYASALVLASFISCTANDNKLVNAESSTDSTAQIITTSTEDTSNGDELKEFGILKEVEDSGYPFATLTIEFPERKFTEYFTINFEEAKGANLGTIQKWVGKYVSFTYTSELSNALLDVQIGGKSLVSEEKIELSPETKKIEGILSGADEETPSDLPGKVTITANDNTTMNFAFFVTKELVGANGKAIVGFYEERAQNNIKSIKLSSK